MSRDVSGDMSRDVSGDMSGDVSGDVSGGGTVHTPGRASGDGIMDGSVDVPTGVSLDVSGDVSGHMSAVYVSTDAFLDMSLDASLEVSMDASSNVPVGASGFGSEPRRSGAEGVEWRANFGGGSGEMPQAAEAAGWRTGVVHAPGLASVPIADAATVRAEAVRAAGGRGRFYMESKPALGLVRRLQQQKVQPAQQDDRWKEGAQHVGHAAQ